MASAAKRIGRPGGFEIVAVEELIGHPRNTNVMPAELFAKLKGHIGRSGRYPVLVVRSLGCSQRFADKAGRLQILDGHHRLKALKKLGCKKVRVDNWGDLTDCEADILVATLNRLEGQDDPDKRAVLLAELQENMDLSSEQLAEMLPETLEELEKLLALNDLPAELAEPDGEQLALPWTVFATVEQIVVIEEAIAVAEECDPPRERGDTPQGRALCMVAGSFLQGRGQEAN